jgi:hypothetical protein
MYKYGERSKRGAGSIVMLFFLPSVALTKSEDNDTAAAPKVDFFKKSLLGVTTGFFISEPQLLGMDAGNRVIE